jgi:hypothetical protein
MDYSVSGTASLVGVHQAGTSYDSGTITATIAGYPASVTWGQTDTAASVAGHLVSAITRSSAGSLVTAILDSNNANYINLASKTAGASTDYSVSVTESDALALQYPNLLTNPSFSAVGDNMAGGTGAVYSYGTIYSYAAAYAAGGPVIQIDPQLSKTVPRSSQFYRDERAACRPSYPRPAMRRTGIYWLMRIR